MNWEVIAWTLITVGVLLAVYVAVMSLMSARSMKNVVKKWEKSTLH